jgi:uncharacterized protein (DUF697 family)
MTRKQLPKVISRCSEELRKIVDSTLPDEAASAARPGKPDDAVDAKIAPSIASLTAATAKPRLNGVGLTVRWQGLAARRRSLAQRVIERHGAYAAVGGLAPVPIANRASVAAIIVRMVKQLSELYGIPFERDRTRSLVVGILAGAVPTGFGTAAASTLGYLVPGAALVGLGVSALMAGALTRSVGLIFIESFEREGVPLESPRELGQLSIRQFS